MHHCSWIEGERWLASDEGYAPYGTGRLSVPFRHFGLVHLARRETRSEITWDLDHADANSLNEARRWLAHRPEHEEISLHFFKHGWRLETFSGPRAALERFEALTAFKGVELLNFAIYDRRTLDNLERAAKPLAKAYSTPEDSRECALIIGPDALGDLVYQHIGEATPARRFFGADWAERTIGARFDRVLDDQGYEASTLPAYLEALDRGEPVYHHVLASIERAGREPVWCNMQRLVLPLPADRLHVTVVMTPGSEIPFLA